MKSKYMILGIGWLVGLMSCSEQEVVEVQSQGRQITATAVTSGNASVFSRLGFEDKKDDNGGVGLTWGKGDKFYMEGTNGAYAFMDIAEGEVGKKSALFAGILTGTLTENESVKAYYPSDAYDTDNNCFKVDLRESTQDCSEGQQMNHLSSTYYMTGKGKMQDGSVEVTFVGGTKISMLRFDLTLPQQSTSLTIDELLIVCDDLNTVGTMSPDGTFTLDETQEKHRQTVNLTNLSASTTAETTFSVYVNVLPVTFTDTMRLKVQLSDETVYWCDVNMKDVELKANNRYYLIHAFLEEEKVGIDYSWYTANTNATTFQISDEADLRGLAKIVNGKAGSISTTTFNGKTIELKENIDLKVDWLPIGYADATANCFRGTFKGNNHTISGIYCDEEFFDDDITYNAVGFFGITMGATIENLTVQGIVKSNLQFVGGLVGRNIKRLNVFSVINNCRNEINVFSNYSNSTYKAYVGGVIGYTYGTSIIQCSNAGTLKAKDSEACLGGIVGGFSGVTSSNEIMIMACYNEGTMESSSSTARVGGIVAFFFERDYSVPVIACYNLSEKLVADGSAEYKGGIVGYQDGTEDGKIYLYGCYSISDPLSGHTQSKTVIDESSCLVLDANNKNSQDEADALNAGIYAWNTKTDGVNGSTTHAQYCNYKFAVGTNHLVVVEGAPDAPTSSEEGQE